MSPPPFLSHFLGEVAGMRWDVLLGRELTRSRSRLAGEGALCGRRKLVCSCYSVRSFRLVSLARCRHASTPTPRRPPTPLPLSRSRTYAPAGPTHQNNQNEKSGCFLKETGWTVPTRSYNSPRNLVGEARPLLPSLRRGPDRRQGRNSGVGGPGRCWETECRRTNIRSDPGPAADVDVPRGTLSSLCCFLPLDARIFVSNHHQATHQLTCPPQHGREPLSIIRGTVSPMKSPARARHSNPSRPVTSPAAPLLHTVLDSTNPCLARESDRSSSTTT